MKKQEDKTVFIISTIGTIGIGGAIICGILECFDIHTGIVGVILAAIPVLSLGGFIVWCIFINIWRFIIEFLNKK